MFELAPLPRISTGGGGALPYLVILEMCGQNGWVFQAENLRMGVNLLTKNLRMGHNFDIILPGNGCMVFL